MKDGVVVYSAIDVARICGVATQTALDWVKGRHLKAFSSGDGQWQVYPEDLLEFMRERNMPAPPPLLEDCGLPVEQKYPRSVLIVDDDKALNTVVMEFLKRRYNDMQVYQAFSGFEAGAQMVIKQPSCVILDIDLPGVDGVKICKHIKESEAFGKPAIVVVTALEDSTLEQNCLALGVSRFFKKPVDLPTLADSLQGIL